MAFFDWNGDGNKDFSDDFIEFMVFQECMEDNDDYDFSNSPHFSRSSNSNSGCGCLFLVVIFLIILGMIGNSI